MQNVNANLDARFRTLRRELEELEAIKRGSGDQFSSGVITQSEIDQRRQIIEKELAELRKRGIETEEEEKAAEKEEAEEEEAEKAEQTSTVLDGTYALPPDPLAPARDRGARLDDLLAFTWPETEDPYVSANFERLLRMSATRVDKDQVLRPRHVFDVLLHKEVGRPLRNGKLPSVYLTGMRDFLRNVAGAGDLSLGNFEFPSEDDIAANTNVVIGPELVAILLRTSSLREKTNVSYRDAGVRHFLAALLLEEIGRIAIDSAGLTRPNFVALRDAWARMIEEDAPHYADLGDDPKSWRPIVAEMRQVALPRRGAGETHAFANDRTDTDLLGTGRDAAALADLLLLDDLVPPVAVGVFGPWGSGKSTLIEMVRQEIEVRTAANESEAKAPKVVQIKFDAWSHADAENLWASLTAELFDQLADALDGRKPDGKLRAGLMTEIAKRLRKDAEVFPLAADTLKIQRDVVQNAETTLAGLEHEPVATKVAGEMAQDLFAAATPKPLSDEDKKNQVKVREANEAEENKKRLHELLQACGVPKDERDPEKLAPILSGLFDLPSRATLLFILLRRSIGHGIVYGLGAALAVLIIGAGGAVWHLGWGRMPEIWTYAVSGLPSLAVLGTLAGTAGVAMRTVTPILRLAADFLARKEKRAAELTTKRREAAETVKKEREKLDTMVADEKKAAEFAETYSIAAEGRSREGLLRYFISFSPELTEVRKKLGLLATVRRCFETLEQIMREKHAATQVEGKPTESKAGSEKTSAGASEELAHVPDVKRIIVYIDDLDRCSEQHVVQVLQAIQLLLAFDLFVVVVAVDARWLHRAVGQVYSGQLAQPDQPAQSASATVADYLEKIFQLPIWMPSIGDPATVERFIRGIDRPDSKFSDPPQPSADRQRDQLGGDTITVVDVKPDPTLVQIAAERRAAMSEPERRALTAMALLAGKSPRGLKRLVNTYRLIRVMRGPTGIVDLERGGESRAPLYPYLLFALACEVGLTTETTELVAKIAGRSAPEEKFHPLVVCFMSEHLDGDQALLRARLNAEGALTAVFTALGAVYVAAAGRNPSEPLTEAGFANRHVTTERFVEAFAAAARFTFRPRSR